MTLVDGTLTQAWSGRGPRRVAGGLPAGVEIAPVAPEDWDGLVDGFDDALHDHTAFLGADLWRRERLDAIEVRRGGETIGAAQLVVFRAPFLGAGPGVAYAKFAPLWQRKGRDPERAHLGLTLQAMVERYAREQGLCLTVVPQADPEHCAAVRDELEGLGFRRRRGLDSERRYLVDCSLDEEAQRRSLAQKWRYNLKKSLKNGLSIEIVEGEAGVEAFMSLHDAMRGRKGYSDETWVDRLPHLYPEMPERLRPTVVLATHEGTPTAGAVIGRLGKTATYLFGGTDERALGLKAGYALQWWIVDWLSGEGVRWYDLDGDSGNAGLRQFKSGLVGKAGHVVQLPGEFDYCERPASRLAAETIQALRRCRNGAREALGKIRAAAGA